MKPTKGKTYHVRLPGSNVLSTMEVYDVTEKTVLLEEHDSPWGVEFASRYLLEQVEFVEEVK